MECQECDPYFSDSVGGVSKCRAAREANKPQKQIIRPYPEVEMVRSGFFVSSKMTNLSVSMEPYPVNDV